MGEKPLLSHVISTFYKCRSIYVSVLWSWRSNPKEKFSNSTLEIFKIIDGPSLLQSLKRDEIIVAKAVNNNFFFQIVTIRENVLFGKEMNKAFYDDVLEAYALNRDINIW